MKCEKVRNEIENFSYYTRILNYAVGKLESIDGVSVKIDISAEMTLSKQHTENVYTCHFCENKVDDVDPHHQCRSCAEVTYYELGPKNGGNSYFDFDSDNCE